MDWQVIFGGVAAGATIVGGHAWIMNMIIDRAVTRVLLVMSKEYVTKEEFDKHLEKGH